MNGRSVLFRYGHQGAFLYYFHVLYHRFNIHIAGINDHGIGREPLRIFNKEVIHTNEEVGVGDEQPVIACDPAPCATDSFVQSLHPRFNRGS